MIPASGSYSLRRRLLFWLLLPLSLIGLLMLFDAYRTARLVSDKAFDRVLSGSALAIAERVFVNEAEQIDVDIPYVALDMLTSSAQDRVFYRLEAPADTFITGYRKLELPETPVFDETGFAYANGSFRGSTVRVVIYRGVASTGRKSLSFRVAVAETTNARAALTREILFRSASRLALLILAAGAIVWVAVTRSLVPLRHLEEAIGRRSPSDLRPIRHGVPHEVVGLVHTINGFMGRLDTALSGLKNFTANASHQIRTPMTIIRTQLALARRAGEASETDRALAECDAAVVDAERILSQLLLLARVDQSASHDLSQQRADLADVARSATSGQVLRAADAGIDLGFDGPESLWCHGQEILLREMIVNLIDNAIKHARNADHITVVVREVEGTAEVAVIDNGEGIDPQMRHTLFERFASRDDDVGHASESGSGLGLAVVREIARLYNAQIELLSNEGEPGTSIRVVFAGRSPINLAQNAAE